jgi:8-oxo-dGTP pyrophosphatase MutT (NUDIX family)
MSDKRVQAIIIQNKSALFGCGCINREIKKYGHYFIGGRVEENESPDAAIIREIKEEANVKARIIFRFNRELHKNHITYLADIGDQRPVIGFDPEETNIKEELRTLQKLQFIKSSDIQGFTGVDIEYFKLLINECMIRNYYPDWYKGLLNFLRFKNKIDNNVK